MHYETVTQHNNHHPLQNPVIIWAKIINRVLRIPGANQNTQINSFWNPISYKTELITSDQIRESLRWACRELGYDKLGFYWYKIGCHSIRLGAAMAMYLNHEKTFTIMLQGRWCSDAFLKYIRKQVQEFSIGVSTRMVSQNAYNFYTTPDCTLAFDDDNEDLYIPNNPRSLTSSFDGSLVESAFTRHHIHE